MHCFTALCTGNCNTMQHTLNPLNPLTYCIPRYIDEAEGSYLLVLTPRNTCGVYARSRDQPVSRRRGTREGQLPALPDGFVSWNAVRGWLMSREKDASRPVPRHTSRGPKGRNGVYIYICICLPKLRTNMFRLKAVDQPRRDWARG